MRLICPNCGAQYEIGEDLIPTGGRDVQCSNCGHTWFEEPGASQVAEALADIPESSPAAETEPAPQPEPEPEREVAPEPEPDTAPEADVEAEASPQPRQRELDPDVADILREEAAYEEEARQSQADPIETQPDLGLTEDPDEDRRSREARDRLSRLRGEPETATAVGAMMAQDAETPRRELLPDIEEINSTLRPDAGPADMSGAEPDDLPQTRSGFRRGFMYMVVLALLALAAYVFASQISAAVPSLEALLTSYVEWVDGLRIWLDMKLQGFIGQAGDAPTDASVDAPADAPES